MAYAAGEASPAVVAHVEDCPACRAAAGEYIELQLQLGARLYRFDCPPPHALGEYELGLIAPEERTRVAGHVSACPHCAAELRALRDLLAAALPSPAPAPLERLRRTVATLLASPLSAAYAGLRGPADLASLTYQAGELTIAVDAGAGARRARVPVTGLIWRAGGAAPSSGTARLIDAAGVTLTTALGPLGDFGWEAAAPGVYRLEVELPGELIVVEELRVGG